MKLIADLNVGRFRHPGVLDFVTHLHHSTQHGDRERHLIHRIAGGFGLSSGHRWFFGFIRIGGTTWEDRPVATSTTPQASDE